MALELKELEFDELPDLTFDEPEDKRRSGVGEFASAVGSGVVSTLESGTGTLEMMGMPFAKTAREFYSRVGEKEVFQRPSYLQEQSLQENLYDPVWWTRTIGENLPTMAAMMMPAGMAGVGVRAAGYSIRAAKYGAMVGGFLGSFSIEAGSHYNSAKRDMEEKGNLDADEIESIATKEGIAVGLANAIIEQGPLGLLLRPIPGANKIMKRFIMQSLAEGGTEGLQENVAMLVEKAGHNPELSLTSAESIARTVESVAAGLGLGFIVGGAKVTTEKAVDYKAKIKDKLKQRKDINDKVRDEIVASGVPETEVAELMNNMSPFEKQLFLVSKEANRTMAKDRLYNDAIMRIRAKEPITPEMESVIEERYEDYINAELVGGDLFNVDTATKVELISEADINLEQQGKYQEGLDAEYPSKKKEKKIKERAKIDKEYVEKENKLKELKANKAEAKEIVKAYKEMLSVAEKMRKPLLRKINSKSTDGAIQDALKSIPSQYKTKDGQSLDELAMEYTGGDINAMLKMIEGFENNIQQARAELGLARETVKDFQKETVSKTEIKDLEDTVKAFKTGVRTGTINTKRQVEQHQTDFIEKIKQSGLTAKDKEKFIKSIKRVKDIASYEKEITAFNKRVKSLFAAQEKNKTKAQIKKEFSGIKPVKGKNQYDYTTHKDLKDLRDIGSLTKKAATERLLKTPEPNSELDRIKVRLLELKASGNKASQELHNQVLKDIQNLKQVGKDAKDAVDLETRLVYGDKIDTLEDTDFAIKGDKRLRASKLKTKIGNLYRHYTNMWSWINSMFGRKIADEQNMEIEEDNMHDSVFHKEKATRKAAGKIYGVEDFEKKFIELSEKPEDNNLFSLDGTIKQQMGTMEIIDLYNSMKNPNTAELTIETYGQEQITNLISQLTQKDITFADMLQDEVADYFSIFNERNIEQKGLDLREVEGYWPRTSKNETEFIDGFHGQSEVPSPQKERANKVKPVFLNAYAKFTKHVAEGEHTYHMSRKYESLMRLYKNPRVERLIKDRYGNKIYSDFINQMERLSLNAHIQKMDAITGILGKGLDNWVAAKVALNPSTFARQLGSVTNFMENMSPVEWTKGFYEGISKPKETFDFMWKNTPSLEARFGRGYSEAMNDAMAGAKRIGPKTRKYTMFLTSFARVGDIGAIIYGGYPLVKSEIAKGKTKEDAFETFRKASLRSQQSGLQSALSGQQARRDMTRLFTSFRNTTIQYLRKTADALISYQNGDISKGQLAKTIALYNVVQPIFYTLLGTAATLPFTAIGSLVSGDDDKLEEKIEDLPKQIAVNLLTSPTQGMILIDEIVKFSAKKAVGAKAYKAVNMPVIDVLNYASQLAVQEEITAEDWWTIISSLQELGTKLPTETATRIVKKSLGE